MNTVSVKRMGSTTWDLIPIEQFLNAVKKVRFDGSFVCNHVQYDAKSINLFLSGFELIKVGEIVWQDLNADGAFSSGVSVVFVGGKPAGKYVTGAFLAVLETFVDYNGTRVTELGADGSLSICSLEQNFPGYFFDTVGQKMSFPNGTSNNRATGEVQNVIGVVTTNAMIHSRKWEAGRMGVYILVSDFPTLS